MSQTKRVVSFILCLLLAVLPVSALSGCNSESSKSDPETFMVYYTNQEADDIIYREQKIKGADKMDQVALIEELLNLMFTQDEEDTTYYTVCPEEVKFPGINVKDGLVTLDFNKAYTSMSNVREIIFRASVVLTLIQVPQVQGVAFTVEGAPIINSNGEAIGTMTQDTFVNVLLTEEGMLKQETDLTIYFADDTGTMLEPVVYRFTLDNSNYSMEEYMLSRLIEGPADGATGRTLSPNVTLNSVVTTDHVCYVNFGKDFLDQEQLVSDDVMIYSIVNSLCQLPYVSSVKFLIDGETDEVLHGTTDLSNPFVYESSYVAEADSAQMP